MGNSSEKSFKIKNILKKQRQILFGQYEIVQAQNIELIGKYLLKVKNILSSSDLSQLIKECIRIKSNCSKNNCLNLITPIHIQLSQTNTYCSDYQQVQIYYDLFEQDLESEFLVRKHLSKPYQQSQILTILKEVLYGIQNGKIIQEPIYHVFKKSIFRDCNKKYKILPLKFCEADHPYYEFQKQSSVQFLSKHWYLAPQLITCFNDEKTKVQFVCENNIFSLGMTILSLCLLRQIQYESKIISLNCQVLFDQNKIKKQLENIKALVSRIPYSSLLKKTLLLMIEYDIKNRISLQQLLNLFKLKQDSINLNIQEKENSKNSLTNHESIPRYKCLLKKRNQKQLKYAIKNLNGISEKQNITIQSSINNLKQLEIPIKKIQAKQYKKMKIQQLKNLSINKMLLNASSHQNTLQNKLNSITFCQNSKFTRKGIDYLDFQNCIEAQSTYELPEKIQDLYIFSKTSIILQKSQNEKNSLDNL